MENSMDRLYWSLLHLFQRYRQWDVLYISDNYKEAWFRNEKNVVRLKRETYDWSNQIRQDIGRVYQIGTQIKTQFRTGELNVINYYLSDDVPVDDWEYTFRSIENTNQKELIRIKNYIEAIDVDWNMIVNISERFSLSNEEIQIIRGLMDTSVEELKQSLLQHVQEVEKKRKAIFNYATPKFTKVLLTIQVIVFILMTLWGGTTNPAVLIQFGAKYNPLLEQGEWWRLVTSMFIHIGFFHLLMNTLALYYIGNQLESMIGSIRFLSLYFLAGIGGSFSSYLFNDGISAGASGAIFGCFGALFVVASLYKKIISKDLMKNIGVLIVVNLVFGLLVPNIDNAAHVGGLLTGALVMFLIGPPKLQS